MVTSGNIGRDVGSDVDDTLERAESEGLAVCSHGQWYLTEDGQDAMDAAHDHPHYTEDREFADEVLTGFDKNGDKSSLVNPVLSKGRSPRSIDPDRQMVALVDTFDHYDEMFDQVMRRYGYSLEKTHGLMEDNRLAVCPECQCWGVFRFGRGDSLRAICTICEGRKREAN